MAKVPLLNRRSRSERVAELLSEAYNAGVEATKTGFGLSPMGQLAPGGLETYVAPPAQLAGLGGTPGIVAQLLARDPGAFGGGLGPAFPLGMLPLDPVDPKTGRPDPRLWQYQVAWNLDLQGRLAQWNILSSAAVQIDIFSRAIAIRCADVTRMDGTWQVAKDAIDTISQDNHVSMSEAAKTARTLYGPMINDLSEQWENPYPQQDRSWEEWITEALWQSLVYDGLAIHPRYNLGGKCIGFEIIEASTIKCLIDDEGGPPEPPNPAYQQILWGFPRGEFLATPEKGSSFYLGGEFRISERDQLSYFVINRRTNSPYGISPVEMGLQIANVYVERLKWLMAEYQYGSTAKGYIETNTTEMSKESFADWNRMLNQWFSGQTSTRQLLTVMPEGFKPPQWAPTIEEKFKEAFDEMLIKRTAAFFGVQPSQFGVIPRAGLGGGKGVAEGEQDQAETLSSKPMNRQIERFVNSLARRYQGATRAVTFQLTDDEGSEDKLETAKAHQTYFSFGGMTANQIQDDLGQPRYDFPEADEPMIVTATGITPLRGVMADAALHAGGNPGESEDPQGSQETLPQEQEGSPEAPRQGSGKDDGQGQGGKAATLVAQADELRDFAAFVKARTKRGNWRAFEFSTFDEATAEALNERGYFIAKGAAKTPENLFAHFMGEVERGALGETPKGKRRSLHNIPHISRIAAKHRGALETGLAGVAGVSGAIAAAVGGAPVHGAVVSNLTFDSSALETTLRSIYQEAGTAAFGEVADQFGVDAETGGMRLQALLDQAGITIKGVEDTAMDRLMTQIQDGVNAGETAAQIADRVAGVIDQQYAGQATNVAMTEANRAYGAAMLDAASAAGATQVEWVCEGGDPCPSCDENQSNGPYDIGDTPDFPDHPNCLCTFTPVVP